MPSGISKTDELRVQAFPELIQEIRGLPYYISTKMDGDSVTMYWIDKEFGVCGRNYEYADDGKCSMWDYAKAHHIEEKLQMKSRIMMRFIADFCMYDA